MSDFHSTLTKRWLLFSGWIVLSSLLFIKPLSAIVRLFLSRDDTSYLALIPFISGWVFWLDRRRIFPNLSIGKTLASTFLFLAACVALATYFAGSNSWPGLQFSGWILSLVLVWTAGFGLLFGKTAMRAGRFPLLFLVLMVPLPNFLLDRLIYLLQEGSAWVTGAFFDVASVPVLREGLVFHLARVNIEVARECSGIRSSMALVILALLVSHFRLKSFWSQILFVACGVLMMIVKNGIRIATLTLLAMYVDPNFLFGRLHHQGGVVFFILALVLLLPLLLFLERMESKSLAVTESPQPSHPTEASST